MIRNKIILLLLFPVVVAAGPCGPFEQLADTASDPDGGAVCQETCEDRLTVTAVRSDNLPFEDGTYSFSGTYPEGAYVTSECLYDSLTLTLECQNAGMIAEMTQAGKRIALTFQGAPESLVLTVWHNQVNLGDLTLSPIYDAPAPLDSTCEATCRTAEEIVSVETL